MSERVGVELTVAATAEHAAVRAWAALGHAGASPARVSVLREGTKTAAHRLHGVGPGGTPVIAKRCRPSVAAVERIVYEKVLGERFTGAVRYYGFVEEGGSSWLFLEDAGGSRFSTAMKRHRLLAARWLALLHLSASRDAAHELPAGGAPRHLTQLRSARETMRVAVRNPVLRRDDAGVLRSLLAQLDRLESRWSAIAEICATLPPTLVHGDLQPKNLRVRAGDGSLVAIDWETAGWGSPAVDLGLLAVAALDVDALGAYHAAIGEDGDRPDLRSLRRVAEVGIVFRRIAEIEWEAAGLSTSWPQRAAACMRLYHARLAEAMRGGVWTR